MSRGKFKNFPRVQKELKIVQNILGMTLLKTTDLGLCRLTTRAFASLSNYSKRQPQPLKKTHTQAGQKPEEA